MKHGATPLRATARSPGRPVDVRHNSRSATRTTSTNSGSSPFDVVAEHYRDMTEGEIEKRRRELEAMKAELDQPFPQTDPTKADNGGKERRDG
jgi:hypothetical protein